jgi:hypothetical protein
VAQGIGLVAACCCGALACGGCAGSADHGALLASGHPLQPGLVGLYLSAGVYTLATFRLGAVLHLGFFGAFGSVLALALALLWLVVGLPHGGGRLGGPPVRFALHRGHALSPPPDIFHRQSWTSIAAGLWALQQAQEPRVTKTIKLDADRGRGRDDR